MRFIYTKTQLKFLKSGYKKMCIPELTKAFNKKFRKRKSRGKIKSTLKNHGFKCGRKPGSPKGSYELFTGKQVKFLAKNYKKMSQLELAAALNKKFGLKIVAAQIKSFTKNHKILSGRRGCFSKGHKPWNTGTKGAVKPNSGSFKKGSIPANIKPLGTERICTNGYILIKVAERNPHTGAPTRYRHKHQVVWEANNGPIPDDHIVSFKDGDKLNCKPDNIVMISKQEHKYLNSCPSYKKASPEIRYNLRVLAKLEVKRFEIENREGLR